MRLPRQGHRPGARVWALFVVLCTALFTQPAAAQSVYTVASYPAEARASDAVTAKNAALAQAQTSAWRYLMKRLVAVTAYQQLPKLPLEQIENLIDGVSVRDEQNSATDYLATLDINFKAGAVQKLLKSYNLPFLDRQSGTTTVLPVFAVDAGAGTSGSIRPEEAQKLWRQAWSGLDLAHALTPVRLAVPGPSADNALFVKLAKGDIRKLGIIEGETSAERLIVALAMVVDDGKRLEVTLIGRDWAGDIWWQHSARIAFNDLGYTAETAAILSLAVLEGRWKARSAPSAAVVTEVADGWAASHESIALTAQFDSLGQWQQMRQSLGRVPGVEGLQVGQLSTRQAEVTLAFPGGIEALVSALQLQGFSLTNDGGRWTLRPA
jgi:hypothetical protein